MAITTRFRTLGVLAPVTLLAGVLFAACSDSTGPRGPLPPAGIVVLNAFGQQGVTLLADSGAASTRINLPFDFDGGGFAVARDTALTTSSKGAGDKLLIVSLRGGSAVAVQLPSGSNPAGAAFSRGAAGNGFLVALRDSGAIARVSVPTTSAAPIVTLLRGAGRCPTDVFTSRDRVWSVDANLDCDRGGYTPQGASRLIRLASSSGGSADTIDLVGAENAGSALVIGDVAFVGAAGFTDYSSFPFRVVSSGALLKVDLLTRRVVDRRQLPSISTGGSLRRGGDGTLFVRYYGDVDTFPNRVLALDPVTLAPRGPRAAGQSYLALRKTDGSVADCGPTTSDALGRFYCVENGTTSSTLIVFDTEGVEIRRAPAGQGAVDIALR